MDTDGGEAAARDDLAQLEQVRWVLGGLLEIQDLRTVWPIRILLTAQGGNSTGQFVTQNGNTILVLKPSAPLPVGEVASLLLDQNTPRLPGEAEQGLRDLFSTLQAHGSRVSWGGPLPAGGQPSLAFARMQLFATKFEYKASFHVFVNSLKNGSSLRVAERNAFGRDPEALEKEVEAQWKAGHWEAVAVSGRPLDPKRDLGEHSIDGNLAGTYLGDAELAENHQAAETLYKAAIEAGGPARAAGFAGLATAAALTGADPKPFVEDAIKAGNTSAYVFYLDGTHTPAPESLSLLKKAAQLNPRWAAPVYAEAEAASDPAEKETLLKKAASLDPRNTSYWLELAQLQASDGHAIEAQSSWLRAEDSAPNETERDRIRKLHEQSEQDRLNAADQERSDEREAAHREDQRARAAENDRIHAAEQKANESLSQNASGDAPAKVVPWEDVVPQRKLSGVLTSVVCGRQTARILVRDKGGKVVPLSVRDWKAAGLSCGAQQNGHRIAVTYAAEPDEPNHTAGRVLSLRLQ